MRRRSVAPRATALAAPASTPAARSRLWAIAAHSTQAELAPKRPEVICSSVVAQSRLPAGMRGGQCRRRGRQQGPMTGCDFFFGVSPAGKIVGTPAT